MVYTPIGDLSVSIGDIIIDSRKTVPGSLFIAIKGYTTDGHLYIDQAIERGAVAVLCDVFPQAIQPGITYIQVDNTKYCAGIIAHTFFEKPSTKLNLIGVTGTNGKTTVAFMLYRLFSLLGHSCGLLSTVEYRVGERIIPAARTTPDPVSLSRYLAEMLASGCTYAFMEVSSHAIDQERISGLEFAGAIFTNLTQDHLDYHKTMEAYRDVKKSWFDSLRSDAIAISNADDRNGSYMLQNTQAIKRYYGLRTMADYKIRLMSNGLGGLHLLVDGTEIHSRLRGKFNASNLAAVYAMAAELNQDRDEILRGLSLLKPVKGRFETVGVEGKNVWGIIDYAHTPDALLNILDNILRMKEPSSKVITVTGCGGDRDRTKRPLMARIAFEKSDLFIMTSDNPRTEDPQRIIQDMMEGIKSCDRDAVMVVLDRKEAIKIAAKMARPGDVVLIAGKGHEMYQEIHGKKIPFDEVEIFKNALK